MFVDYVTKKIKNDLIKYLLNCTLKFNVSSVVFDSFANFINSLFCGNHFNNKLSTKVSTICLVGNNFQDTVHLLQVFRFYFDKICGPYYVHSLFYIFEPRKTIINKAKNQILLFLLFFYNLNSFMLKRFKVCKKLNILNIYRRDTC